MNQVPSQAAQVVEQPDQHELQAYCLANDAQLALCSLYANRWYTMKRLHRVCARLSLKAELKVWDQFLIRRTGQRMVTFISDIVRLPDGHRVSAAVIKAKVNLDRALPCTCCS